MARAIPAIPAAAPWILAGALVLVGAQGLASAAPELDAPAVPAATTSAAASVEAASRELFEHLLRTRIDLRLRRGLPIEELPDLSAAAARTQAELGRRLLQQLRGVPVEALSPAARTNLAVLRWEAEELSAAEDFHALSFAVTPYSSPLPAVHQVFESHRFATARDLESYLPLLERYAVFIQHLDGGLRQQAARGMRIPKPAIAPVVAIFASVRQPEGETLFAVSAERLAAIPVAQRDPFRERVSIAIRERIDPALRALEEYLAGPYLAAAPEQVGWAQYPGGADFYRRLVRAHTTLEVSPEEVHRIGLAEIERIDRDLDEVRRAAGFEGSLAEFRSFLKSDSRFFPRTPEEIAARLNEAQARLLPSVGKFFGRQPRAAYGVERLDPALEPGMTFGYYDLPRPGRPRGVYFFNGSKLSQRSLLMAPALIYHELVPGHHFQFSLQQENGELPEFRRESGYTAFIEGWGEYASGLAGEMGMYRDPYDRAGRLMMDAFLSARLVVDTGMNALGWSREQASEFLRAHTLQSETEIASETLRYCCDIPGQALAYKMGALELRRLRSRAESELGPAFDIRRFHDLVLSGGALPMAVLAQEVESWIAAVRAETRPAAAGGR